MLSKQQMLDALSGLIVEAERLHQDFLTSLVPWHPDFVTWLKASEATVEPIFGARSDTYTTYSTIRYFPPPTERTLDAVEHQKAEVTWFDSGLSKIRV